MIETTHLRALLLPELEAELATTRRVLAAIPDGNGEFKCHDKSMSLTKLAGHVAELPSFIAIILTTPRLDMAAPSAHKPFLHDSRVQTVTAFDSFADAALTALKHTSDQTFDQTWPLVYGDHKIFHGTRYNGYRSMGLNHLVHHRAQLGVYLRLLGASVPKSYGPTADER
jgi:uncharacterized damage-inducible protein DinB